MKMVWLAAIMVAGPVAAAAQEGGVRFGDPLPITKPEIPTLIEIAAFLLADMEPDDLQIESESSAQTKDGRVYVYKTNDCVFIAKRTRAPYFWRHVNIAALTKTWFTTHTCKEGWCGPHRVNLGPNQPSYCFGELSEETKHTNSPRGECRPFQYAITSQYADRKKYSLVSVALDHYCRR